MKKMYILALAALAMAFSCQKTENSPEPASEPVVRTFTCTFAQPDTKLAIDDANGKTTWEVGDKIMIHGGTDGAARQLVTLAAGDISADGKSATISVTIDPYDRSDASVKSKYYAQYPGNLVPTGNMYYECCFNATNDKLMAACDVDGAFVFYNLCGIISYKVSGDFDQVVFSGNNNETVGYSDYYQVRVRNNNSGMEVNYHKPGNGFSTNTAAKSITAAVVADGTTVNTICIPNPAGFTGGFTMKFLKGGAIVKTLSTTSPVSLTHGQYRPMGNVTAYLKDYVAPSTHDSSIPVAGATALDGSGNANCYIVDGSVAANAEKVFTFKAYKGNSSVGVGTVASAVILWETYNNAETVTANSVIAAVDFEKKSENDFYTMVFKMPETLHAGNALIAAKDISNNILWSWHIWVPQTTVTAADYGIHTSGKNVMDRNLGALVVAEASTSSDIDITSVGLYYQWGRKDPFPGPREIKKDPSDLYASPARVAGTAMTTDKVQLTVDASIKNPTFFARGYYDGSTQKNPDWCSEAGPNYWGDDGVKSVYDPCPVGYRVPLRDKTKALWAEDITTQTGWEYNTDHYWFKVGSPAAVFPAVGYMDGGSIKTVFRTTIWNAHSNDYKNTYDFNHYAAYSRRIYLEGSTLKHKNNGDVSKSIGCSVRCVAE